MKATYCHRWIGWVGYKYKTRAIMQMVNKRGESKKQEIAQLANKQTENPETMNILRRSTQAWEIIMASAMPILEWVYAMNNGVSYAWWMRGAEKAKPISSNGLGQQRHWPNRQLGTQNNYKERPQQRNHTCSSEQYLHRQQDQVLNKPN